MDQKNLNFSIDEGSEFFCHELSINFNPMQFIFDFKSVTPRVDVRSKQNQVIRIKHNVVMLDPYHAKKMLGLLSKVIEDYENSLGEIKKPGAVAKMEKDMEKKSKNAKAAKKKLSADKKTIAAPTYFG